MMENVEILERQNIAEHCDFRSARTSCTTFYWPVGPQEFLLLLLLLHPYHPCHPVTIDTSAMIQIQSRGPFWNKLFLFNIICIWFPEEHSRW